MLPTLVAIVKIAGIATLAILAWAALGSRTGGSAEADELAPRDPVGARVMRAFTAMLVVGAVAMFAITAIDMAGHV